MPNANLDELLFSYRTNQSSPREVEVKNVKSGKSDKTGEINFEFFLDHLSSSAYREKASKLRQKKDETKAELTK